MLPAASVPLNSKSAFRARAPPGFYFPFGSTSSRRQAEESMMPVPYEISIPALPARPEESHKGSFGSVLLVAGSRGMSGAACLAGLGALRGGAGLVTVTVPAGIQQIVASTEPSYLTVALPEDDQGRISRRATSDILSRAKNATAVAIGPGWGRSADLIELADLLYADLPCP